MSAPLLERDEDEPGAADARLASKQSPGDEAPISCPDCAEPLHAEPAAACACPDLHVGIA